MSMTCRASFIAAQRAEQANTSVANTLPSRGKRREPLAWWVPAALL
jgi:hypothetical protein